MTTEVMTIDQLIESLETTRDENGDDLYVLIGEPVGSDLSVTFDSQEESAQIESTQGWAYGVFDSDEMDALSLSNEVGHYLFGSLLVEGKYLSDGAIEVTLEDGDSE